MHVRSRNLRRGHHLSHWPLSSTMTPFTWEWIHTKDQGYPDHTGLQGSQFTAEVQSQHAFAVLNAGADFRCAPAAFCDRASGKPSQLCVALLICILSPPLPFSVLRSKAWSELHLRTINLAGFLVFECLFYGNS